MMVRSSCYDNLNVKKGLWTAEEDAKVLAYVSKHGTGNWTAVPKKAGLKRCGKSCRLRYTNYLRPDLKHDNFSPQEEELIVKLHSAIGSRWSMIAQQLPGRTDNDVKNYWNTKLKKKLTEMGIDPVTHKPFSQILTDYGNLGGGFPKGGSNTTRIGSFLNRDLKNAFMIKSEHDQTRGLINCQFMTADLKMSSPEVDLTRNSFFNNNNNDDNNNDDESNNNSLNLLAQLQAIKLVSDQATSYIKNETTIQANFMTEKGLALSPSSSSLSSSSSSTCSTAAQVMSPQAFSWEDFLLEDAFFLPASSSSGGEETQSFVMPQRSEYIICSDGEKKIGGSVGEVNNGGLSSSFEASTSSDASFVEAMLERDNEMLLEFPSLLEEPFYY